MEPEICDEMFELRRPGCDDVEVHGRHRGVAVRKRERILNECMQEVRQIVASEMIFHTTLMACLRRAAP